MLPSVPTTLSGLAIAGTFLIIGAFLKYLLGGKARLRIEEDTAGVEVERGRLDLARNKLTLVDDYEERLLRMSDSLSAVRRELDTGRRELDALNREFDTIKNRLADVQTERDDALAANVELREEIVKLRSRVARLEAAP